MSNADDIAKIIAQEQGLVFTRFDEGVAFSIGQRVRERALAETLKLVVDVRLWDRQLFFAGMPGTTADNARWVERKVNTARHFLKSSYRVALERSFEERVFPPQRALDAHDYAIAGGAFLIVMAGLGPVGCVTISGLTERLDHQIAVDAVCAELGRDRAGFALSGT